MSTAVKSPNLSQSSSRETTSAAAAWQSASQQRPRGASAFRDHLSDLDLAATYTPSTFKSTKDSNGSQTNSSSAGYGYAPQSTVQSQSGSDSEPPTSTFRQPGSLNRLFQGQDTVGARRPGSSMEPLRRGSAQQTAIIPNSAQHPLSPIDVDPIDRLSWTDATAAPQPLEPPSSDSSKFSLISFDEVTNGATFQSSQPSVALMNSSLNDADSSLSHGLGRRATAPAEAIAQHRPKSPATVKQNAHPKSRESLGPAAKWQGPPHASSLSYSSNGAASLSTVGSTSTGSGRNRDGERSRSPSPAREFVRNYLKTTASASVTPPNTSPSVQRLMAVTSTVAQTIRANVVSAVSSSGTAAGSASSSLANAATTMLLGASNGGNNKALHQGGGNSGVTAAWKQTLMHDRHLLDTSVPDGLAADNAPQLILKHSFSTSTASTDMSTRLLSSSHLAETLTPSNHSNQLGAIPLAMQRLSCAAPVDKIVPSDWSARTEQLVLTMDMLLQDTRAIVGEINTSLEAAEQDNLAVGVKLATARTKLRSLVAWEATSTQAVVGWLNMAVSRHRQIEGEVKDWGSRPASPKRALTDTAVMIEEVGPADSGQGGLDAPNPIKSVDEKRQRVGEGSAQATAAFELFDQTMTPSDFSLASRPSADNSLNTSGSSAVTDFSGHSVV